MIPLGAFGVISYTFYSMIGWTGTTLPLIIPGCSAAWERCSS